MTAIGCQKTGNLGDFPSGPRRYDPSRLAIPNLGHADPRYLRRARTKAQMRNCDLSGVNLHDILAQIDELRRKVKGRKEALYALRQTNPALVSEPLNQAASNLRDLQTRVDELWTRTYQSSISGSNAARECQLLQAELNEIVAGIGNMQ